MSNLDIYKASAGSGKTFTLTFEYIKLLFSNTYNFKKTLAVTFTNKASGEMKTRIIRELHKLAVSDSLPQEEKSPYLKDLCEIEQKSEKQIQQKALFIQNTILHNYSHFNIETIDSFFQRVVQNFAKELGIYGGYSIELDSNMVIEKVIDLMFMDLDTNAELKKWLTTFSEEKILEGKNRDISRELKTFGQEIFKEEFTNISPETKKLYSDKQFLFTYFQSVKSIVDSYYSELQSLGEKGLTIIKEYGLTLDDFPYKKSSFASTFVKASQKKLDEIGKRALDALESQDKWFSKTSKQKDTIISAYNAGLHETLSKIIKHVTTNTVSINTAQLILKNSFTLGMLADIADRITNYCEDEGIFLLSNNNRLLKLLIDENDAPFIYEKIGGYIANIMIDEFQDTSQMQWGNFRPLIGNCISEKGTSLVVGDVKQSIYRWRNGDWSILSEQIYNDFQEQTTDRILDNNWRSYKNVIDFNNSFFAYATSYLATHFSNEMQESALPEDAIANLANKLTHAYANSYQHAPASCTNAGYINICFDKNKKNSDIQDNALNYCIETVEKLQSKGYEAKDIAILVRTNTQAKLIADYFQQHKTSPDAKTETNYEIVSNEALLLTSAASVNFIIQFLRYVSSPNEEIALACIRYASILFNKKEAITHSTFKAEQRLNEDIAFFIPQAHRLSLFELTEQIIASYKLDTIKNETPFIQAFQDAINDFTISKNSSIASFLDWWDEKGSRLCVSISDDQNAIKLMTIHKSKGLEFKAIILPFSHWDLMDAKKAPTLWCEPPTEPFNALPLVPVKADKKMGESFFAGYYFNEKLQSYIDSINILYVAFTRAEQAIFLYTKQDNNASTTSGIIEACLRNYENIQPNNINNLPLISFPTIEDEEMISTFEYGDIPTIEKQVDKSTDNINLNLYPSYALGKKIVLATHGLDFFEDFDSTETQRERGLAFHYIFENIVTHEDIPQAVEKTIFEGKLPAKEKEAVIKIITELISKPQTSDWFSNNYEVKNEQAILLPSGKSKRPDRVMIKGNEAIVVDYKFTEKQSESHGEQVKEYIDLLSEMNYSTKGYVWYVLQNNIIEFR